MNRVAVVTGSASGVGLAICRLLSERGWRVVGLDIQSSPPATGVETIACDLRSAADIDAAFAQIGATFGRIDALIYSAGILRVGPLESMSVEDFDAVHAVNVRGAWLCARAAIPALKRAATADAPAHIVFISSVTVFRPKKSTGAYAASKAALSQMTRVLAAELAADNVLVNALAPGSMDTPMTRAVRQAPATGFETSEIPPIGRKAVPDDVARATAMLLGPDSRFITGVTIAVDGGASAVFVPGTSAK